MIFSTHADAGQFMRLTELPVLWYLPINQGIQ
jgi:hypothetical protein